MARQPRRAAQRKGCPLFHCAAPRVIAVRRWGARHQDRKTQGAGQGYLGTLRGLRPPALRYRGRQLDGRQVRCCFADAHRRTGAAGRRGVHQRPGPGGSGSLGNRPAWVCRGCRAVFDPGVGLGRPDRERNPGRYGVDAADRGTAHAVAGWQVGPRIAGWPGTAIHRLGQAAGPRSRFQVGRSRRWADLAPRRQANPVHH